MLTQMSVDEYVRKLASGEPTPGGGSAAALAGALATASAEMVANFTVGKEKYADVEEDVRVVLVRLQQWREKLLQLTDADAEAYAKVGEAYGMPKQTDEQKALRDEAVEEALKTAAQVPLEVTESCAAVIEGLQELAEKGNPNLLSDVGVCAELGIAALRCGRLNVQVNLAYIEDEEYCQHNSALIDERLSAAEPTARKVFEAVTERIISG